MRRSIGAAAVAGIMLAGSFAAAAQVETGDAETPAPAADRPSIDLGPLGVLEADPDAPVQICVLSRTDGPTGSVVEIVEAYLTPSGFFADAPKAVSAVGPLADARPLECRGVAAEILD